MKFELDLHGILRLLRAEIRTAYTPSRPCTFPRLPLTRSSAYISKRSLSTSPRWRNQDVVISREYASTVAAETPIGRSTIRELPVTCPGCGALTQSINETEAGYYTSTRAAVQRYLTYHPSTKTSEDLIFEKSIKNAPKETIDLLDMDTEASDASPELAPKTPICDRCHKLVHHNSGVSIHHPTLSSIEETIYESPHKTNHIYHVLDAADFPMSLEPNIHRRLALAHLRTQNRRSKSRHYVKGQLGEMSFVITRSDLLAPKKEQVDALMPQLRQVLRDAMGSSGKNVRLGNVYCVSAKRGWWTRKVKEDIWERGGGGWLVGKVNVGKSNLFEVVFPRGRNEDVSIQQLKSEAMANSASLKSDEDVMQDPFDSNSTKYPSVDDSLNPSSALLPPTQPQMQYPVMPIISELPGTTASPIRVPFGNGKGELIDLPGLERSSLQNFVRPEHRLSLIMKSRISPEKIVIKPGSSIILGGLLRITPKTPDLIFLAYPFVTLKPHLTSTEKAIGIHTGEREFGLETIVDPSAHNRMASAGLFELDTDMTRAYSGPLTRRDAVGLKPEQLPFVIYSTDILIEGCGWVEISAQVRRPRRDALSHLLDEAKTPSTPSFPVVEVFSPEGRFIGQRQSLGAWSLGGPKPKPVGSRKARPRMSMRSVKNRRQPRKSNKSILMKS